MDFKAREIADILKGTVEGDPEVSVNTFARIENGKAGAISFYANPKYEKYVYLSNASVIIVNRDFQPSEPVSATMIRVENAYSAIAELLEYVNAQKRQYKRHRAIFSRIRFSAKIGSKVSVGNFSYVGRNSRIGDCSIIHENVYIGDDCSIGHHCIIYPGVKIYPGSVIGNNVILQANVVIGGDGFGFAPQEDGTYKKIEHTGNVIIEDDVEIGANTTVDKSQMGATIIRRGVKIDNLCQIAHNVEVGENTVICAQTGIAGSTKIGKHCVLAGQVGVSGHITIADNTNLGPQCGVMSSIKKPGQSFMGTPCLPYNEFMRSYAIFKQQGKSTIK